MMAPKEAVNDDVECVDVMGPSGGIGCCGDVTGMPSKKILILILTVIAVVGVGHPGALLLFGRMQDSKSILQREYTSTREDPTPGLALRRKLEKEQTNPLQGEITSRFIEEPDISAHDITQVMDWIKAEMTKNIIPFCWKQSYGRGIGKIPGRPADCPSGYIQDGATCRLPPQDISSPSVAAKCPSGYTQDGLTCRLPPEDIYSPSVAAKCPDGFRNDGLSCFRDLHTYGKCCTTIWSKCKCKSGYVNMGCHCHRDAKALGLEGMTCPDGYSKGQPFAGRCYKRCEGGRTRIGENCHRTMVIKGIDSMTCPGGYSKGQPFAGRCYKRCEGGRTRIGENCHRAMVVKGIESMTCKEGEEKIGARCFKNGGCGSEEEWRDGLCYKKCRSGYYGEGPVCYQTCDSSQFNCAAACATDEEECGSTTADQVISTLVLAANIATLGLGSVGTAPVGKLAKVQSRVKTIANFVDSKTLTKLTDSIDAVEGVQGALKVYKKLRPARVGLRVIEAADTLNTYWGWKGDGEQFYDDMLDYTTSAADAFVEITSQEISEELDRHYEPHTSNFLKQQWALIQLSELAEAKGWDTALTAMTIVGFVDPDPTGVLGAVAAYAKPMCKEVKEFPCIIADLSYDECRKEPDVPKIAGGSIATRNTWYTFKMKQSDDLCLDLEGAIVKPIHQVWLYQCNNSPAQQWFYDEVGLIRSKVNQDYCLEAGYGTQEHELYVFPCHEGTQKWNLQDDGRIVRIGSGIEDRNGKAIGATAGCGGDLKSGMILEAQDQMVDGFCESGQQWNFHAIAM